MANKTIRVMLTALLLCGCNSQTGTGTGGGDDAALNEALYANLDATEGEEALSNASPRDALIARVQRNVRDLMKDPTSVQFKPTSIVSVKGQCVFGHVLAKNSYGAYNGYKGYVWTKGAFVSEEDGMTPYVKAMTACIDASHAELKS